MKQKQEDMSNQELDHNYQSGGVQTLEETPVWNPTPEQTEKLKEFVAKNAKRDPLD